MWVMRFSIIKESTIAIGIDKTFPDPTVIGFIHFGKKSFYVIWIQQNPINPVL